jgi:hypothetical protein
MRGGGEGRGITISSGSGLMKVVVMRLGFWIIGVGLRRRGYKVLRGQRRSDGGRLEGPEGGGLPVTQGGVGWRREESELKTAWPDTWRAVVGSRAPRTRDRRGLGWSIKISIAHTKLLVCLSNFK